MNEDGAQNSLFHLLHWIRLHRQFLVISGMEILSAIKLELLQPHYLQHWEITATFPPILDFILLEIVNKIFISVQAIRAESRAVLCKTPHGS